MKNIFWGKFSFFITEFGRFPLYRNPKIHRYQQKALTKKNILIYKQGFEFAPTILFQNDCSGISKFPKVPKTELFGTSDIKGKTPKYYQI